MSTEAASDLFRRSKARRGKPFGHLTGSVQLPDFLGKGLTLGPAFYISHPSLGARLLCDNFIFK
jgi:hypothetical protein